MIIVIEKDVKENLMVYDPIQKHVEDGKLSEYICDSVVNFQINTLLSTRQRLETTLWISKTQFDKQQNICLAT